jgi:hypothetical protein
MSAAVTPASSAPLRSHLRGMTVGLLIGLACVAIAAVLTESQGRLALGLGLAGIGWVYLGFAVADGRRSAIAVQAVSASVFLWIAYLGVHLDSGALLGGGFLGHAAWDAVHHEGHGPTRIRTWYPPFCVVADVVIAIPLLAGWL